MSPSLKTIFSAGLIFLFCQLGQPYATQINIPDIESITLKGDAYTRYMIGGDAYLYSPFHSALVADFKPTIKLNRWITFDSTITLQNPSISDGYDAEQHMIGRFSVLFHSENNDFGPVLNHISLKYGDLGKYTLGKGLLLKDLESEGTGINLGLYSGIEAGLTVIGHGYSDPGDYYIFYITNSDNSLGGYLFPSVDDSASYRTYCNILGAYTSLNLLPNIKCNIEAATGFDNQHHSQTPMAILFSPQWHFSDENCAISLSLTGRYYTQSFNAWFQQFYFHKTYHGIDEEFEDFDNWRNYLINSFLGSQNEGNAKGLAIRSQISQHLWGPFWFYGDIEFNRQYYSAEYIDTTLYRFGGQLRVNPKQFLYMGVNNKVLASDAVMDKLLTGNTWSSERDSFSTFNAPVLVAVDPFVEVGTNIEF